MNREIKFRCWDTYFKKMFAISDAKFINGTLIGAKGVDWENGVMAMQYIGLKDKNGKEIYEGDIVSYSTNYYGNLRTGKRQVVEWEEDLGHEGFGEPLATGYILHGYDWEVIGNIHENPELLNE